MMKNIIAVSQKPLTQLTVIVGGKPVRDHAPEVAGDMIYDCRPLELQQSVVQEKCIFHTSNENVTFCS